MDPNSIISLVVAALAGGATVEAKKLGSRAVSDTYHALKEHLIRRLGPRAVEAVEQEPTSANALSEFEAELKDKGLQGDGELEHLARSLERNLQEAEIADVPTAEGIRLGDLRARVNLRIASMEAEGPVVTGSLTAELGDIDLGPIRAGLSKKK